jgi:hypothetical protein
MCWLINYCMSIATVPAKDAHLAGIVDLPQSSGMRSTPRLAMQFTKVQEAAYTLGLFWLSL